MYNMNNKTKSIFFVFIISIALFILYNRGVYAEIKNVDSVTVHTEEEFNKALNDNNVKCIELANNIKTRYGGYHNIGIKIINGKGFTIDSTDLDGRLFDNDINLQNVTINIKNGLLVANSNNSITSNYPSVILNNVIINNFGGCMLPLISCKQINMNETLINNYDSNYKTSVISIKYDRYASFIKDSIISNVSFKGIGSLVELKSGLKCKASNIIVDDNIGTPVFSVLSGTLEMSGYYIGYQFVAEEPYEVGKPIQRVNMDGLNIDKESIYTRIENGKKKYFISNSYLKGVLYKTHVEDYGWQDWKSNGGMSGTSGESKRLEGIRIQLGDNLPQDASIVYRTHVQDYGWQDWKCNGEMSGTRGESKRLEAIQIKLENAPGYSVEYRTHVQDYGWQDWKSNGEVSGTSGEGKRIEAIEIRIVKTEFKEQEVGYRTHVEDYGWLDWKYNGELSGTSGEAKRLEGIEIKLDNLPQGASIVYRTHVQEYGWLDWKRNGEMSGTSGESKRLEAIQIKLENAPGYSVEYRTHVQDYGWRSWKSDGEMSGTSGESKRLEAIKVRIVKK